MSFQYNNSERSVDSNKNINNTPTCNNSLVLINELKNTCSNWINGPDAEMPILTPDTNKILPNHCSPSVGSETFVAEEVLKEATPNMEDSLILHSTSGIRKSERIKKNQAQNIGENQSSLISASGKKKGKSNRLIRRNTNSESRSSVHNNLPFCCDKCKSPYIVNPLRQSGIKTKKKPSPRHKIDPVTKKLLTLCNACGLATDSSPAKKKSRSVIQLPVEDKEKYLQDGKDFSSYLASTLNDPDAKKLFCPQYKNTGGCGCLQKFIKGEGEADEFKKRASHLLQLHREAKRLSQQKFYQPDGTKQTTGESGKPKRMSSIGLGNGQKKSRMFEEFVLENRHYLRKNLRLCEKAAQHLLVYSNNFLHKRLKTEPARGPRVERQKGKAALGLLSPVEDLQTQHCCSDKCVSMALTHSHLLHTWRERAVSGQAEARRVLAEMLTPCGGARSNCYKFISLVTGCSHSTICSVNEQMKRTGGNREPPEHGLKQWWKDHPRPKLAIESSDEQQEEESHQSPTPVTSSVNGASATAAIGSQSDTHLQLEITKQQVAQLQNQIAQQQMQIQQQQQQILEQQLIAPQILQLQQTLQQILQDATVVTPVSTSLARDPIIPIMPTKVMPISTTILPKNNSLQLQNKPELIPSPSTSNILIDDATSDITNKTVSLKNQMDLACTETLSTDYSSTTLPSVNITILQQPVTEGDHTSDVGSQQINPAIRNLVLIDPSSLIISGTVADPQIGTNTCDSCTPTENWDQNE